MSHFIVMLLCLVPHESMPVERCGLLELNHIVTIHQDPWGGQPRSNTASYWLGWRRGINDDIPVVDWWRRFGGEELWYDGARRYMLLWDKDQRLVLVAADSFRHHWTDYDIELEQRRIYQERYGVAHTEYRRGLARTKPQ